MVRVKWNTPLPGFHHLSLGGKTAVVIGDESHAKGCIIDDPDSEAYSNIKGRAVETVKHRLKTRLQTA